MKRFYLLILTIVAAATGWSQGTYTWQGGATGDYQVAANWSPSRSVLNAMDTLLFSTGSSHTVTNFPTSQTIGRIRVFNNTTVRLEAPGGLQTLTVGNGAAVDFFVETGSTFIQDNSMNTITMATNSSALINGVYTIDDCAFAIGTGVVVTVNGVLDFANSGAGAISGATATTLQVNGEYAHRTNGGTVPTASWNAGSTLRLNGITTTAPAGLGQAFRTIIFASTPTAATGINASIACENLTFSNTGANGLFLSGSGTDRTLTVSQNYLQTSGIFGLVGSSGDGTLNVTGNFTLQGGTFLAKNSSGQARLNVTGNYSQTAGTYDMWAASNTSTSAATITGDFSLSGGTFDMSGTTTETGVLNVAGDFNFTGGTITETSTGDGDINFNGTAVQTFVKSGTATISNTINFNVNNNAKVDFGTSVLNGGGGTFTLLAGGKIITANTNGLSATGSVQITRSYNSGADYEFQGPTTGTFTTTTANTCRNFTVNNVSGQVILAQAMAITGALTLTNGYLTTTAALLPTVGNTGTSTSANNAYVNGPLAKSVTSSGVAFTFYVGNTTGGMRTIGINTVNTPAAGTTIFTARFFSASPNTAYPGATLPLALARISNCEYWTLDRSTGGTKFNATVTLSWTAASNCASTTPYVTNPTTLRVARHNGAVPGQWTDAGYSTSNTTNPYTTGTVTSGTVTAFSPFTIASSSAGSNPLPVMFADVKAYAKNDGVQVDWSNLTERDLINYVVERSTDGSNFTVVNTQLPKYNNNDKATYNYFDASPVTGANYYRVRVNEISGKIIYSKVLRVDIGSTKQSFGIYPNPVTGRQFTVSLNGMRVGQYSLKVYNTAGQPVYEAKIINQGSATSQALELPASIKAGVYTTVLTSADFRESKLLIVQ